MNPPLKSPRQPRPALREVERWNGEIYVYTGAKGVAAFSAVSLRAKVLLTPPIETGNLCA